MTSLLPQRASAVSPVSGYYLSPQKEFWSLVTPTGTVYPFFDLGLRVLSYPGGGMPPISNLTTPFGTLGGEFYQRTVVNKRVLTIICQIEQFGLGQLQSKRQALINYLVPNNLIQQGQLVTLRYQLIDQYLNPIGKTLDMPCYYLSGLEGLTDNHNVERIALQFEELAPPSIKETTTNTTTLCYATSLTVNYLAERDANGNWGNMAAGMNNGVSDVIEAPDGTLYATGQFTTAGGGAANYIAKWNGTAWSALGTGLNTVGQVLAIGPDGSIYVGGNFTTAGGSAANFIAKWNGTAWSALGTGLNNQVLGMTFDFAGNLYVAGAFTTAGGGAANRIAKWDGTTWSALSTGLSATGQRMATGKDGSIYVTGTFVTAGGVTVNNIAKWDGTAWSALGTGLSAGSTTVAIGLDGSIYVGGSFATANGITVNKIAKWNGVTWSALSTGLNNDVTYLSVGGDGTVYATGVFTATSNSGLSFPNRAARWNGSSWLYIDTAGLSSLGQVVYAKGSKLRLGFSTAGAVNTSCRTSLIYGGTAGVNPTITITGPGTLYQIINYTTGKNLYFNYTLLAGESAVLTLTPTNLSFISSFYGNILGKILPGSDISAFGLTPGTNLLSVLIGGTTTGATLCQASYQNTHWSFDAGAY